MKKNLFNELKHNELLLINGGEITAETSLMYDISYGVGRLANYISDLSVIYIMGIGLIVY